MYIGTTIFWLSLVKQKQAMEKLIYSLERNSANETSFITLVPPLLWTFAANRKNE